MSTPERFRDVLAAADTLHDERRIASVIAAMAAAVDAHYHGSDRTLFLTVMQGGLFFAAQLGMACTTDSLQNAGTCSATCVTASTPASCSSPMTWTSSQTSRTACSS